MSGRGRDGRNGLWASDPPEGELSSPYGFGLALRRGDGARTRASAHETKGDVR